MTSSTKLSPFIQGQIARALIDGESISALSERLGIDRKEIAKIKRDELAVPPSTVSPFFTGPGARKLIPGWKLDLIASLYDNGATVRDIATRLGMGDSDVRWLIKRKGRVLRTRHKAQKQPVMPRWSAGDVQFMRDHPSLTNADMAAHLGRSTTAVNLQRRRLIKAGELTGKKKGYKP